MTQSDSSKTLLVVHAHRVDGYLVGEAPVGDLKRGQYFLNIIYINLLGELLYG